MVQTKTNIKYKKYCTTTNKIQSILRIIINYSTILKDFEIKNSIKKMIRRF